MKGQIKLLHGFIVLSLWEQPLPPAQVRMVEEKRPRTGVHHQHSVLFWLWLIGPKGTSKCSLWEESRNLFAC